MQTVMLPKTVILRVSSLFLLLMFLNLEHAQHLLDSLEKSEEVWTKAEEPDRGNLISPGQLLSRFIFDPITHHLDKTKTILESIHSNVDMALTGIFSMKSAVITSIFRNVLKTPNRIIRIWGIILPGSLGRSFSDLEEKMRVCSVINERTPIRDTLMQNKECLISPMTTVISNMLEIITDVQSIIGGVKEGLNEIEKMIKITPRVDRVMDTFATTVSRVIPTMYHVVGSFAKTLAEIPKFPLCVTGNVGKNLIGQIILFAHDYMLCMMG